MRPNTTIPANSPKGLASALPEDGSTVSPYEANYNPIDSTWTGPLGPDDDIVTIHGTLDEVRAQAEALANPGSNVVVVKREANNSRSDLTVAKTDCWPDLGVGKTPPNIRAPIVEGFAAIDELADREGKVKLEEPGCQRVACSGTRGAVFVCWEPVDDAPEVYKVPWSTVAEYARSLTEEWCKPYVHPRLPIMVIGGKVWDPQGMVVYVKSDKC